MSRRSRDPGVWLPFSKWPSASTSSSPATCTVDSHTAAVTPVERISCSAWLSRMPASPSAAAGPYVSPAHCMVSRALSSSSARRSLSAKLSKASRATPRERRARAAASSCGPSSSSCSRAMCTSMPRWCRVSRRWSRSSPNTSRSSPRRAIWSIRSLSMRRSARSSRCPLRRRYIMRGPLLVSTVLTIAPLIRISSISRSSSTTAGPLSSTPGWYGTRGSSPAMSRPIAYMCRRACTRSRPRRSR
mmetsp:Transcript_36317/g.114638  ORF Transcript_36317/g.114638 Transcript_36317/m.114638 type:complete len:245 (+) Transcript_36317:210-944(+)